MKHYHYPSLHHNHAEMLHLVHKRGQFTDATHMIIALPDDFDWQGNEPPRLPIHRAAPSMPRRTPAPVKIPVNRADRVQTSSVTTMTTSPPTGAMRARHEPTTAEMTANFAEAVADWVADGFKVVPQADYEQRRAICNDCPEWEDKARLGLGKCKLCGCTRLKLWLSSQTCPASKWPVLTPVKP